MAKREYYRILESYRDSSIDVSCGIISVVGAAGIIGGAIADKPSFVIGGSILIGTSFLADAASYMKAYMEARLDRSQNGSSARSKESKLGS